MTRLALIRHAPTLWNEAGRIQGRTDTALSPRGRAMAASWRLPAGLARWPAIASPLRRCLDTALLLGLDPPAPEPRLIEMDWGAWAGERLHALRARDGGAMAANEARGLDFRPEGGESPREVQARLAPLFGDLAGAGRDALAVTHRGVVRAALGLATGWDFLSPPPLDPGRAGILMLVLEPGGGAALDAEPALAMDGGP